MCYLTFYWLDTGFITATLEWTVFGVSTLDTMLDFIFNLFFYHSARVIWKLFDRLAMYIDCGFCAIFAL